MDASSRPRSGTAAPRGVARPVGPRPEGPARDHGEPPHGGHRRAGRTLARRRGGHRPARASRRARASSRSCWPPAIGPRSTGARAAASTTTPSPARSRRPRPVPRPMTGFLCGSAAATHLFRVCAGLESLVLGEAEILGQVRAALETSPGAGGVPARRGAGGAARRRPDSRRNRRSESARSRWPRRRCSWWRESWPLAGSHVVVVGAGATGVKVARHLRGLGVRRLVVANRGRERADAVAATVAGETAGLESLPDAAGGGRRRLLRGGRPGAPGDPRRSPGRGGDARRAAAGDGRSEHAAGCRAGRRGRRDPRRSDHARAGRGHPARSPHGGSSQGGGGDRTRAALPRHLGAPAGAAADRLGPAAEGRDHPPRRAGPRLSRAGRAATAIRRRARSADAAGCWIRCWRCRWRRCRRCAPTSRPAWPQHQRPLPATAEADA